MFRRGVKGELPAWLLIPNRIGARSKGLSPGRARCFLQKCTVTNFSLFRKPKQIPWCPVPSLCTTAQPHTRLSASAPLYGTGRWSSGDKGCPGSLRISLIQSPFYSPPFFGVQRIARGSEPDMILSTIEERYRSVNGGWVGGIRSLPTPWAHRL